MLGMRLGKSQPSAFGGIEYPIYYGRPYYPPPPYYPPGYYAPPYSYGPR